MTKRTQDWDPTSEEVLRNQVEAYDEMRARCPVARSELLGWSLFKHEDVVQVLEDPQTFSNVVSTRRSVPSGMDPPEHTVYRQAIEPYFDPERLGDFAPRCRRIASSLLSSVAPDTAFDFIEAFAVPFASHCQCASLGWSAELAEPVSQWTRRNREAILADDRSALAEIAS